MLLVVLNDQQSVATRVTASEAAQITSAFYVRDVQSAEYFTTTATPTTPLPTGMATTLVECGVPATGNTLPTCY